MPVRPIPLRCHGSVADAGTALIDAGAPSPTIEHVVLIVIDGMRQSALYDALNAGELPNFAKVVCPRVSAGDFSNAVLFDAEAIFPSITLAATAAIHTGKTPGESGVYGNEFFDRLNSDFIGFVAESFSDIPDFVGIYLNTGLANDTLTTETLYEKARDQRLSSTVVFAQYSTGTDRWITPLDLSLLRRSIFLCSRRRSGRMAAAETFTPRRTRSTKPPSTVRFQASTKPASPTSSRSISWGTIITRTRRPAIRTSCSEAISNRRSTATSDASSRQSSSTALWTKRRL
ncbi:MAG: alkaline phosphatase family protein [Deltaproteobacteria bacterium]|nr:alkaline phosphatase family protein [Deltaproteobacteria bacterium]